MKAPVLFFIIGVLLLACHSNTSDQFNRNSSEQYAYILSIPEKADTIFIDADYVQYLTGDSAIEAAKKKHMADTFTIDGTTHIDVPNDYFILNENKNIRRLALSKQIVFDLLLDLDRADHKEEIKDNSLKSFKEIYKNNLFLLAINNNEVAKIKEVFLP